VNPAYAPRKGLLDDIRPPYGRTQPQLMSSITLPKVAGTPKRGRLHNRVMQRESTLGYALLVPTMLMLLVFLAWPFLWGIWLSVSNAEIGNDSSHFVGIGNFVYNLSDTIFVQSFWNTMAYTAITTVFKFGLGMSMALLLNQVFPLQRFARAALLLPWIIPSVLSTLAWRWMFDPTFSILNWVLMHSIHSGGVNWLGTTNTALASIFIVNIWRGAPFYGISLLAGLQTIPPDLYEAARVDGASRWQQFREITLPLLRPVLLVVLIALHHPDLRRLPAALRAHPWGALQLDQRARDLGLQHRRPRRQHRPRRRHLPGAVPSARHRDHRGPGLTPEQGVSRWR